MNNEEDREALARLVDPKAWREPILPETYRAVSRDESLMKADAILAAGFHRTPAPALPQEMYAPEVFERMKALLQEAHGSPMRALRLAVSTPQDTEWEYAGIPVTAAGEEWVRRSIEECEGLIREHANPDHWVYEPHNDDLHPVTAFRRVRRRKPGPWEPVPTEGEAS